MGGLALGLANAANARDLGGHVTADGRTVRTGVLFRSNALSRLSDDDVSRLAGLGLACLVDFQHPYEIELVGPDRLPEPPPPRVVSLPLFEPEHDVFTTVSALMSGRAGPGQVRRLHADHDSGGAAAAMVELYRWLVTSPLARQAFATALRLIATADALPLLFHCTAGKDRTGWLAATVLSSLGVARDAIVADYLLTNECNARGTNHVLATVAGRVADPAVVRPLLEARLDYLEAAFAEVDLHYGGMTGYVRDGLGIDDATVAALHANLLHDPATTPRRS